MKEYLIANWWIGAVALGVLLLMGAGLLFYETFRISFQIRSIVPKPTKSDVILHLLLGWAFVILILLQIAYRYARKVWHGDKSGFT